MDDKEVDKLVAELMGPRRRGRPRTGDAKAWEYTQQYEKFRRDGMTPWKAVQEVAKQNRKRPEHISACRKKVYDNYLSYIEDLIYETWRDNMAELED